MTEEKKSSEPKKDRFQEEFDALPLEEKFAKLFRMEATAFGEAFNYAVNSPMKVVEKVGDLFMEFGAKIETEVRKAAGSTEAKAAGSTKKKTSPPPKNSSRRTANKETRP